MDINKVLFISQEIAPYLADTPTTVFNRDLPQGIQEHGAEVRTFMPKYGKINERRNQLHEVIRLSGMNLIIDDSDHPLIIKVATLQPARMQVYFIYNDDYFVNNLAKVLETESSKDDNDERSIFFVRGVIETVRKLRWIPSVIQCGGWITALAPMYMRQIYSDDPSFRDAKIVYALYADDFDQPLDERLADKLLQDGIPADCLSAIQGKPVDSLMLTQLALDHADAVIQCSPNVRPEVLELVEKSGLPFLPYPGGPYYADAEGNVVSDDQYQAIVDTREAAKEELEAWEAQKAKYNGQIDVLLDQLDELGDDGDPEKRQQIDDAIAGIRHAIDTEAPQVPALPTLVNNKAQYVEPIYEFYKSL